MKKLFGFLAFSLVLADLAAFYVWKNHNAKPASVALPRPIPAPAAPPAAAIPAAPAFPVPSTTTLGAVSSPALPRAPASPGTMGFCKSAAECVAYCGNPDHASECQEFITGKPAARPPAAPPSGPRPIEGGPGGCSNSADCQRYCADPAHVSECRNFSKKNPPSQMQEALRSASPRVLACLKKSLDEETVRRIRDGTAELNPETGAIVEGCFQDTGGGEESGPPKTAPGEIPEGYSGPGGCKDMQACIQYCMNPSHKDECLSSPYIPEQYRQMLQQQRGPSGEGQGDPNSGSVPEQPE